MKVAKRDVLDALIFTKRDAKAVLRELEMELQALKKAESLREKLKKKGYTYSVVAEAVSIDLKIINQEIAACQAGGFHAEEKFWNTVKRCYKYLKSYKA